MIQATKFEAALTKALGNNIALAGTADHELLVLKAGVHVQQCLSMLRNLATEEYIVCGNRRYPKSGGFRKKMKAEHWVALKPLLDKLHNNECSDSALVASETNGPDEQPVPSDPEVDPSEDCDLDGYPNVFKPFFRNGSTASLSTLAYSSENEMPEAVPVTPNPRKRRLEALSTRKVLGKRAMTKKCYVVKKPDVGVNLDVENPDNQQSGVQKDHCDKLDVKKLPIQKVRLHCTSERNARAEITGFVLIDGVLKRMHVVTLTQNGWGHGYKKTAEDLYKQISRHKLSKTEALKMKNSWGWRRLLN